LPFTTRVRIRIETIMLDLGRYLRTLLGEVLGVENEKFGEQFDLLVLDIIGQSMLGQRFSLIGNFVRLGFSFRLFSVRIEGIEKGHSRVNAECLIT
jgi:hypothetical protein